jgi:hypothetical protein
MMKKMSRQIEVALLQQRLQPVLIMNYLAWLKANYARLEKQT